MRAPYRLEPRPGGYTIIVPRPCNDCDGSGIVARVRRHYPTTYVHCSFCKGTGKVEARFETYPFYPFTQSRWFIPGWGPSDYASPREAAEAIVASFATPWNHEPAPRPEAEVIAAVTSFESPV